jgi:type VI secretion system secreted protein VgrG
MVLKAGGSDKLLLITGLSGGEALSRLFRFTIDCIAASANNSKIDFKDLLGQPVNVTLELPDKKKRYFNGICVRASQGSSDDDFTSYRLEVAPKLWLLTRKAQSRIYQNMAVPAIIDQVLKEGGVKNDPSKLTKANYKPRDYCVQYRETDFNFICRLMEEEGIFYYFTHADGDHTMILGDTSAAHQDVPGATKALLETVTGGKKPEDRIVEWVKRQEVRSSKVLLRDHSLELTGKTLDSKADIKGTVSVGASSHKIDVVAGLELYDYPGEFAQRFDGISPGGGEQKSKVDDIVPDGKRTAELRAAQDAAQFLLIQGAGACRQFSAGCKFTLDTPAGDKIAKLAKAEGKYVLVSVEHYATQSGYRTGQRPDFQYNNTFTCIPEALHFRPPRETPKPFVQGSHTATVEGSSGGNDDIFTDKYGRVQVRFNWDRKDAPERASASCWCRVATHWASKQWGTIWIPRVGMEVLVDFLEGDPDQPVIVGCLYNDQNMPPYKLPDNRTQSGIKSRSTVNGGTEEFNELRFEDKKGKEDIYFHAQKDFHRHVENDDDLFVGRHQTIEIGTKNKDNTPGNRTEVVCNNEKVTIQKGNRDIIVEKGDDTHKVKTGSRVAVIATDEKLTVEKGNREAVIKMGDDKLKISMGNRDTKIEMGNDTTKVSLGKSSLETMQGIELKCGQSVITIDQTGVTIKGMTIKVQGQIMTDIKGLMVSVAGDAMGKFKGAITMVG